MQRLPSCLPAERGYTGQGGTKSATHPHRSKGEITGVCILVIYILFKTVPILKRKRKLKPRFSKEQR